METMRTLLQQEYLRRHAKNKNYSLRALAQQVGVHHATLSSLMSGKRKITVKTARQLAQTIGMGREETARALAQKSSAKAAPAVGRNADLGDVFGFVRSQGAHGGHP